MKNYLFIFYTSVVLAGACAVQAIPFPNQFNSHGPLYDSPNGGNPLATGLELVAVGGDVTLDFLGPTTAIDSDNIFLSTPANGAGTFYLNHSTFNGTLVDLGSFAAGTELIFGLNNFIHGTTLYDGPGSRNADGDAHAYMLNNYEGFTNITYVGFEDLLANEQSDWNYVDDVFAVQGAVAVPPSAVPEITSTASLLGFSLFGLFKFRRWAGNK
jgi:hypothetical protein